MTLRFVNICTVFVAFFALTMLVATDGFAEGDAAAGKAIYDVNCANCHGADGNSPMAAMGVPSFANSDRLDKPVDERYESVCKGKASASGIAMPPFCGPLSEADIRNALAYEETFKP